MYCPSCGAANQTLRFCSRCGASLHAAPTSSAVAIDNKVDVTVNVGAPVIITDGKGARSVPRHDTASEQWHQNTVVIALALVFFFPVGLILMWTSSWREDTKWAVSGLFLWPLWARFIWRQRWTSSIRVAAVVLLTLAYAAMFTGTAVGGLALLLVGLPAFVWALRSREDRAMEQNTSSSLRARVEERLDKCHDLIADIESGIGLELLPTDSPIRAQYVRGLEMRQQGADLLQKAVSDLDMTLASEKVTRALSELTVARNALTSNAV